MSTAHPNIHSLGQLKASGYVSRTIKQELRENLLHKLANKLPLFEGIHGYDETVLPELQRAILSEHHIILLGLRGQAKTKIARLMVELLDEYMPAVAGSELHDDPLKPLSRFSIDLIAEKGDDTPIVWIHRSERYTEKLATPDVSVADLIGDADPIKAANLKLPYSDERVIHFGLIPRSHRGIFVINELPDLQARIQVSLFNILQEGDIQIRGFKVRLPLDIQFVFTANPEDYTNRGSIVTPLKDRIDSQIITHYPATLAIGKTITMQEAKIKKGQENIHLPHLAFDLVEQIAIEARKSEYVDVKSGVSARLTISALENLRSGAERRMIINSETATTLRMGDFNSLIPSITGKVELVYEGEQEGSLIVAQNLLGLAIRTQFGQYFTEPDKARKLKTGNPYAPITNWFEQGNELDLLEADTQIAYQEKLHNVPGLIELVMHTLPDLSETDALFWAEFVLHSLGEYNLIGRNKLTKGTQFRDMMSAMFTDTNFDDEEDGEWEDDDKPKRR
jgi:magnesium chelatase subunit I